MSTVEATADLRPLIAANPYAPAELIVVFGLSESPELRAGAAANPAAGPGPVGRRPDHLRQRIAERADRRQFQLRRNHDGRINH